MKVLKKQIHSGKNNKNNPLASNKNIADSKYREEKNGGNSASGSTTKNGNHGHILINPQQSFFYDFGKIPVLSSRPAVIQPKLKVNRPGDKYEQEANQMAEKVMRMPDNKYIQRKCAKCEEEEKNKIQMKGETSVPVISPAFQNQLNNSIKGGQPLPPVTNQFMSKAFGADFSHVRIHDNENAYQLNRNIQARAFTFGSNIYFNKGQFSPDSHEGKRLLAHELTHTIQQRPEIRRQPPNQFGPPPIDYDLISDPIERKLRMETDAKIIMWKDALRRLEKGELTNEDLKNERLMNRLTGLKSAEVTTLISKIEEFQKRKDEERAAASEEDRKKMKEIKTDKIIEWLKVRKVISTPMSDKATVTYNALNDIDNYKLSLKDVNITVQKDTSGATGNSTNVKTNFQGSFTWMVVGGKITQLKKDGSAFNPTSLDVEIFTKYHDNPDETSAYGKGTTDEDKAEKTTTLRVHEGQHGTDFINYLTNNPLPADINGGINGKLTPAQFSKLLNYIKEIDKETCETTDQSGFSQDEFLKTDEGKNSGIKSCRKP